MFSLLPHPPECWNDRCVLGCPGALFILFPGVHTERQDISSCRADLNCRPNPVFSGPLLPLLFRNSSMDEEIENPYWSVRALVQQYEGQQRSSSESSCSRYVWPCRLYLSSLGRKLLSGGVLASVARPKALRHPWG